MVVRPVTSVVVTETAPGFVNITIPGTTALTCYGDQNGTVNYTLSPSANFALPTSVQILDTAAQVIPNGSLKAGSYTLLVYNGNGCLVGQRSFNVTQPLPLAAQASVTDLTCDENGTILISVSGGTPNFTYTWDNPSAIGDHPNNLQAGIYHVTIQDANGCKLTMPIIPVLNTCDPTCDVTTGQITFATDTLCLTGSTVSISGNYLPAANPPLGFDLQFVLSEGPDQEIVQSGPSPQFVVNHAGLYSIHPVLYETNTMNLQQTLLTVTTVLGLNSLFYSEWSYLWTPQCSHTDNHCRYRLWQPSFR